MEIDGRGSSFRLLLNFRHDRGSSADVELWLDPEALLVRAKQQLAGYKCPKEIFVTDGLPKNAAGKVLRKVLRETYRGRGAVK